jgi:hypothetical protein
MPNRIFEFLSAMNDNKYYVRLNGELLEFTRNTLSDRMYCLSISLDDFDELANFVYTERRHKNQKEVTNADS